MSLNADFQKLSVLGIVTLYELDATKLGAGVMRWHGHIGYEDWVLIYNLAGDASKLAGDTTRLAGHNYDASTTDKEYRQDIIWQGQVYTPMAIQSDGLEIRGDGKAITPNLAMANKIGDINGAVSAMCLHYNDFAGAKLTVITTLAKYLDPINFSNGNAQASNEFKRQVWFIEQKTSENHAQVTFELSNPVDFEGQRIPAREITNYCHWCVMGKYRLEECSYIGTAKFMQDGTPTDNPALDQCGGKLSDCKLRFGADNELPFGGFPSSALVSN